MATVQSDSVLKMAFNPGPAEFRTAISREARSLREQSAHQSMLRVVLPQFQRHLVRTSSWVSSHHPAISHAANGQTATGPDPNSQNEGHIHSREQVLQTDREGQITSSAVRVGGQNSSPNSRVRPAPSSSSDFRLKTQRSVSRIFPVSGLFTERAESVSSNPTLGKLKKVVQNSIAAGIQQDMRLDLKYARIDFDYFKGHLSPEEKLQAREAVQIKQQTKSRVAVDLRINSSSHRLLKVRPDFEFGGSFKNLISGDKENSTENTEYHPGEKSAQNGASFGRVYKADTAPRMENMPVVFFSKQAGLSETATRTRTLGRADSSILNPDNSLFPGALCATPGGGSPTKQQSIGFGFSNNLHKISTVAGATGPKIPHRLLEQTCSRKDSPVLKASPAKKKRAANYTYVIDSVKNSEMIQDKPSATVSQFCSKAFFTCEDTLRNCENQVISYGFLMQTVGAPVAGLSERASISLTNMLAVLFVPKEKYPTEEEVNQLLLRAIKSLGRFLCKDSQTNILYTGLQVTIFAIYNNVLLTANVGPCDAVFVEVPEFKLSASMIHRLSGLFHRDEKKKKAAAFVNRLSSLKGPDQSGRDAVPAHQLQPEGDRFKDVVYELLFKSRLEKEMRKNQAEEEKVFQEKSKLQVDPLLALVENGLNIDKSPLEITAKEESKKAITNSRGSARSSVKLAPNVARKSKLISLGKDVPELDSSHVNYTLTRITEDHSLPVADPMPPSLEGLVNSGVLKKNPALPNSTLLFNPVSAALSQGSGRSSAYLIQSGTQPNWLTINSTHVIGLTSSLLLGTRSLPSLGRFPLTEKQGCFMLCSPNFWEWIPQSVVVFGCYLVCTQTAKRVPQTLFH